MRKKRKDNKIRDNLRGKPKIIKKARVQFVFMSLEGKKLDNSNSRLKIMGDGGVSCLMLEDKRWKSIKGNLKSIKIVMERIYGKRVVVQRQRA